jgi:NAD(P)-dependent dehydrogenase (short-subunit alcohol dehydrogenase family)
MLTGLKGHLKIMRLKNKICVVTGASSGIGQSCALAMRQEGAVVVGMARRGSDDPELPILSVDVTDRCCVERAVTEVIHRHKRIDVLVTSAGINMQGTVVTTEPEVWDRLFEVNVRGTYLVCRAVIPHMQNQGAGSIVVIASNYGIVGGRNYAAYSATKGALVILSKAMALDHACENIRVNCVCPGTVETPMVTEPMKQLTAEQVTAVNARRKIQHPIGRIGKSEEIAPGVVYFASDEASFVTGAVLAIDGGFTAQ